MGFASGPSAEPAVRRIDVALMAAAAFGLYWMSSFILEARGAATHFGADTWFYSRLAADNVIGRIAGDYQLDRIMRFHPTTVVMAAIWMKLLGPLTVWLAPVHLLKAMFAAVGAMGVWAATSAFATVVPRRSAILLGVGYAVSFGVWYFSSIEESKIVTASLSSLYIASYLRLRKKRTRGGVAFLTGILLLTCLNEIVSGFLLIIPIVDTLMQRRWDLSNSWWIVGHALAGPTALVVLEGVIGSWLLGTAAHAEGASHFGMLFFYLTRNDYSAGNLYSFVLNWLFFNIAAPATHATHAIAQWPFYKGYFEPSLIQYFLSPVSAGVVALVAAMIAVSWLRPARAKSLGGLASLLVALMAFSGVRGVSFLIFNPPEGLLFSPAVTLAHLLLIGIPLAASSFAAKHLLLAGFVFLLSLNNAAFIIAR